MGDLIGNKIADKITNVSRTLPQNISGTLRNETENIQQDKEILREKSFSPRKKQEIYNDLRYNDIIME